MTNELKPWRYDIQYGPEGEANYAWVYDDHGVMVAAMKTHKAKEIVERMNTRPAAPVEGLETKAWNCTYQTYGHFTLKEHEAKQAIEDGATVEELVARSQAEAIIAAKDATIADLENELSSFRSSFKQQTSLKASNAALTARFKELADERYKLAYAITGGEDAPGYLDSLSVKTLVEVARDNARRWFVETDRTETLETQLAAAKKALEGIASLNSVDMSLGDQVFAVTSARAALKVIP